MAKIRISMKGEIEKDSLISDGWHVATILKMMPVSSENSGTGIPYIMFIYKTNEGNVTQIATLKKIVIGNERFTLSNIMHALGIKKNEELNEYQPDPSEIEGMKIDIETKNKNQEFLSRNGEMIKYEKSNVIRVRKHIDSSLSPTNPQAPFPSAKFDVKQSDPIFDETVQPLDSDNTDSGIPF